MNILLTGATGTLGSKILFSLFEMEGARITKVYLPIRARKNATPAERLEKMICSEFAPPYVQKNLHGILAKLEVVEEGDFLDPKLFLKGRKLDFLIHSAGFVNLSTDLSAKKNIFMGNYGFTKEIFHSYADHIQKFIYISTAFSIGNIGGTLQDDYLQSPNRYRNHYEASKHATEQFIWKEGKKNGVAVQILRPSVLGGNLMDVPYFFISKYMVFYLFAKFFHNCDPKESIRISTHKNAGLNIIPTDYAAKVIVKVMGSNIDQLNIVHSKETNLIKGMSRIFEEVGFSNFSFTSDPINAVSGFASKLEQFYYETIGIHLDPYLTSLPHEWDTTLLESILPLPLYDQEEYLMESVAFAKNRQFRNQQW
ncbi:MAG: SDR family oxidoreductase [Sediminicola sp.]|tara:strand:- start:136508 stop:137608 length:1101 start_codon:yes stop_codon:yes gene_type:complete